jgi:AcrR family transcriptional regulator
MSDGSVAGRRPGRPANPEIRSRRKEEILDAAAKLFAESGYSHMTTQALADELGVGKGTIYRYFPTKRDLFLAAADRMMGQLTATVDGAVASVEDPVEQMRCGIRSYLAFFAQRPEAVELLIQERAYFRDRKKPTYFEYRDANRGRWAEHIERLMRQGRVRSLPADRVMDVMGDLLYGTMFTNYFVGQRQPPAEQAADLFDVAFCGILSDSERQRLRTNGINREPSGDEHDGA